MSVDRFECQPERWSDPPDYEEDDEDEEPEGKPTHSCTGRDAYAVPVCPICRKEHEKKTPCSWPGSPTL